MVGEENKMTENKEVKPKRVEAVGLTQKK